MHDPPTPSRDSFVEQSDLYDQYCYSRLSLARSSLSEADVAVLRPDCSTRAPLLLCGGGQQKSSFRVRRELHADLDPAVTEELFARKLSAY